MKPSGAFRKGDPLKYSEVEKTRAQKSPQKYRNQAFQTKKNDKILLNKFQDKNKPSQRIKNGSPLVSISSSNIPAISTFQKKIREAIQARFQKSKIQQFRYSKEGYISKNQQYEDLLRQNFRNDQTELSSEQSEEMEEMKKFAYLKNESFISIHNYHITKSNLKRESTILKDGIRKRKFKIVNSKSVQSKSDLQIDLTHSAEKLPLQLEQQLVSLSPKATKSLQIDLKVLRSDCDENSKFNEQKRRSLTSRPKNDHVERTSYNNYYVPFDQTQQKNPLKTNSYVIKDTFKLKNVGQYTKNKAQQQYSQVLSTQILLNNPNQKTAKNENQKRRLLLQKNEKKEKLNLSQTNQESLKQFNANLQRIPKTQNKKVFSSRKIQHQILNQPQLIDKNTPKNMKERIKTHPSVFKQFQNNDSSIDHSSKEQKWKLQEISFRFKAINEEKNQFPVEKINNFIDQNQKALKMGFSLEKAYNKILSGRKIQQKQVRNLDYKKTMVSKNEQNLKKMQTIVHKVTTNREERSISNNKRRKLRIRTQIEIDAEKTAKHGIQTARKSNKSIQTPQNSSEKWNYMKQSIKKSKEKQNQQFLASNYKSRQKDNRFSTIS